MSKFECDVNFHRNFHSDSHTLFFVITSLKIEIKDFILIQNQTILFF